MGVMTKLQYDSHIQLAELPYFNVRDGRLVLADAAFGPSIDVHTHLALAYGRKIRVDLNKLHDRTEHYLGVDKPLDLDVYINKNFDEDSLRRMRKDLTLGSLSAKGMRVTHTAPNLSAEMADLGIVSSVLLPIDFPVLSRNAENYLQAAQVTDGLISLGSVHPYARKVPEKLAAQKALGARGIKVHPAVQSVAPDNPRAMRLYGICGDLGLPVLFHCGPVGIEPERGRRLCQLERYAPPIKEYPNTTFVLGHSGALQMEQALAYAKEHTNVYLELASQSVTNINRILDEAPPDRVMMGSDWPFYHQATSLAKVLIATEGRSAELRAGVLHDNAARLFGLM